MAGSVDDARRDRRGYRTFGNDTHRGQIDARGAPATGYLQDTFRIVVAETLPKMTLRAGTVSLLVKPYMG